MSWRIVLITNRCKLDLSMNYLEIRTEEVRKIHLSEIHTLIIESTAVSLTCSLLSELIHRKIKVIFCDEKRNPQSELIPYYGTHDTSARIRQQIKWKDNTKGRVWSDIIAEKIGKQQELLQEIGEMERATMLGQYRDNIEEADASNREGHAAKVYFGGLFGVNFARGQENPINAALNYGYTILVSAFNREIAAGGYLTQIGVFHDNMFNPFNLASDLMEPFRPLIDRVVRRMDVKEFGKEEKIELVDILNHKVEIDSEQQYVSAAIRIYTRSVIEALNQDDPGEIKFYKYTAMEKKKPKPAKEKERPEEKMREEYKEPEISELEQKINALLKAKEEK